ncbi:WD40 repeat-like protein [Penicillium malachiteum]|nr:WD40 repeat-like protein [Penicillium malachiteum]
MEFAKELPTWICQFPIAKENWDAELQTLEGHSDSVRSVAFSPDGHLLASGSDDWFVHLWDLATGTLQQTVDGHMSIGFIGSGASDAVAFTPDGKTLAFCSANETIRLWDLTASEITQNHNSDGFEPPVQIMTFSPDGLFLASGSYDSPVVRIWNVKESPIAWTFNEHSAAINSLAFSPDNRVLVSCSADNSARLWDLTTRTLLHTIDSHSGSVSSVAFSPNGQLLASCSEDNTVCLWDFATYALQQTLIACPELADGILDPIDGYKSVTFSPDGKLLASGTHCGLLCVWDLATGALYRTINAHLETIEYLAFAPDSQLLASCSCDLTMCLWALEKDALVQIWDIEWDGDYCGFSHYFEFSYDDLSIHGNSAAFIVERRSDRQMLLSRSGNLDISFEDDRWVKLRGKRMLWLPVESMPNCFRINGNTLALGHTSGEVSFIRFCI